MYRRTAPYAPEQSGASCVVLPVSQTNGFGLEKYECGSKTLRAKEEKMAQASTPKTTTIKRKPATKKSSTTSPKKASTNGTAEAKTRFNAALDEAKAGAAALKAEATTRANAYRNQAKGKSSDLVGEAKEYSAEAKVKASELAADAKVKAADLANDGKAKASEAMVSLGKIVSDNAGTIDEKLGAKYGDYARTASRSLQETAQKLDAKSVDELGADARNAVRNSPAAAVGIAAVVGFMIARLFRGKRD